MPFVIIVQVGSAPHRRNRKMHVYDSSPPGRTAALWPGRAPHRVLLRLTRALQSGGGRHSAFQGSQPGDLARRSADWPACCWQSVPLRHLPWVVQLGALEWGFCLALPPTGGSSVGACGPKPVQDQQLAVHPAVPGSWACAHHPCRPAFQAWVAGVTPVLPQGCKCPLEQRRTWREEEQDLGATKGELPTGETAMGQPLASLSSSTAWRPCRQHAGP